MNIQDLEILTQSSLFSGLSHEEMKKATETYGAYIREFQKDEIVLLSGSPRVLTGVVLEGSVNVLTESQAGERSIVIAVARGETFGEAINCLVGVRAPVNVITTTKTRVYFIDLQKVINHTLSANTSAREVIMHNLISALAYKNVTLRNKVDILSQRTIRQRVAAFLLINSRQQQTDVIKMPFNREKFAEYLCVNRSALSRELGVMKSDGLIDFNRKTITILDQARLEEAEL